MNVEINVIICKNSLCLLGVSHKDQYNVDISTSHSKLLRLKAELSAIEQDNDVVLGRCANWEIVTAAMGIGMKINGDVPGKMYNDYLCRGGD